MHRSLVRLVVSMLLVVASSAGISYGLTGASNDQVALEEPTASPDASPDASATPDASASPEPSASPDPSVSPDPTLSPDPSVSPDPTLEPEPTDVPAGKWATEGCPEGFTGNHGQYVSKSPKGSRSEAARSPCGKPVKSPKVGDDPADAEDDDGGEGSVRGKGRGRGRGRSGR